MKVGSQKRTLFIANLSFPKVCIVSQSYSWKLATCLSPIKPTMLQDFSLALFKAFNSRAIEVM